MTLPIRSDNGSVSKKQKLSIWDGLPYLVAADVALRRGAGVGDGYTTEGFSHLMIQPPSLTNRMQVGPREPVMGFLLIL